MPQNMPMTEIVRSKNKTMLVKDKRNSAEGEIQRIEAEMRYIFFHLKPTAKHVKEYNDLEAKWLELTKNK